MRDVEFLKEMNKRKLVLSPRNRQWAFLGNTTKVALSIEHGLVKARLAKRKKATFISSV